MPGTGDRVHALGVAASGVNFTVVPQWLHDRAVADGRSVDHLMPVGSWIYGKGDTSPWAMTARLHERWCGRELPAGNLATR